MEIEFPKLVGKNLDKVVEEIGGDWEKICDFLHANNPEYPSVNSVTSKFKGGEKIEEKVKIFLNEIHDELVLLKDFLTAVHECLSRRKARDCRNYLFLSIKFVKSLEKLKAEFKWDDIQTCFVISDSNSFKNFCESFWNDVDFPVDIFSSILNREDYRKILRKFKELEGKLSRIRIAKSSSDNPIQLMNSNSSNSLPDKFIFVPVCPGDAFLDCQDTNLEFFEHGDDDTIRSLHLLKHDIFAKFGGICPISTGEKKGRLGELSSVDMFCRSCEICNQNMRDNNYSRFFKLRAGKNSIIESCFLNICIRIPGLESKSLYDCNDFDDIEFCVFDMFSLEDVSIYFPIIFLICSPDMKFNDRHQIIIRPSITHNLSDSTYREPTSLIASNCIYRAYWQFQSQKFR